MASPSQSSSAADHYDVFLSFRGPDTRLHFTDCLYTYLQDAGITVFRDKEEIRGGDVIDETLIEAIKRSNVSIAIISPKYADSVSCLMELACMLSWRRKEKSHKVIPILFEVERSELKGFPEALEKKLRQSPKLAKMADKKTIGEWKAALSDLESLKYRGVPKDRYWTEVFSVVVSDVWEHLGKEDLFIPDEPVGIDNHVKEIMRKLDVDYRDGKAAEIRGNERRVVAITGIPGTGKTTLAKVIFNEIKPLFNACSFLEGIHLYLQKESLLQKLISDLKNRNCQESDPSKCIKILKRSVEGKKVLIILDGMRDVQDFKALGEDFDWFSRWFGSGSRMILTTSNVDLQKEVLFQGVQTYEVREMAEDLAVQLFLKHAFKDIHTQELSKFRSLAQKFIDVIERTPMEIKSVGRRLRGKDEKSWQKELEKIDDRLNELYEKVPYINMY